MLGLAVESRQLNNAGLLEQVREMCGRGEYSTMTRERLSAEVVKNVFDMNMAAGRINWRISHLEDGYLAGVADPNAVLLTDEDQTRMWALSRYAVEVRAQRPRL